MENLVDELGTALEQMQTNLKKVTDEHIERTWLQFGRNELNEKLRGENTLQELSKEVIDFLTSYLSAQMGAIYVLDEDIFSLQYTHGVQGDVSGLFKIGEGLVGQVASDKALKVLSKVPKGYFNVVSSFGGRKPNTIALLPAVYDKKTIAVIELAKFGDFSDLELKFMKEIAESIAISISAAISQQAMNKLLDKLQSQKIDMEKTAYELAQQVDCLNSSAIVSITDANGDITYVNDTFCEISKYSREELIGKNHRILKSGKQPNGIFVGMWKAISMGRVWRGEILNRAKDGSHYWVDTTIAPFVGVDKKIEKYVAIRFDVTEMKNQKNEIEAITKAIYKSNLVMEFDLEGNVLRANDLFYDLMGYRQDEIIGRHHSVFVDQKYAASKSYRVFWEDLRNGEYREEEFERKTKDGEFIWLKGTYNPILNMDGKPYKILKIATDITLTKQQTEELEKQTEELQVQQEELRQLNEELEEHTQNLKQQQEELRMTNEELEEQAQSLEVKNKEIEEAKSDIERKTKALELSSKYKSEFLANMSHELRTPLNSLLILAKDLSENRVKNLNTDQVESAEIIYKSGRDLLELINEVLDLSKIEAGKMVLNVEKVWLRELTNDIRRDFDHQAEKKGLNLTVKIEDGLPEFIRTDSLRLNQILKNLLSNAIKFTDSGQVTVEFKKDVRDKLAIAVIDSGIGIPEDKKMEIFEAFQQVDGGTSRKYGGTGLGLSISKQLAQLLEGEIALESEINSGSTFTLILPMEIEQNAEEKQGHMLVARTTPTFVKKEKIDQSFLNYPAANDDREQVGKDDKVVLVIDDDLKFAEILIKQARKKGFKAISAATGEDGLMLAEKYKPEAIILDLKLPGISGNVVLSELKTNPSLRHIPVHILSNNDRSLKPIKSGAVEFLKKPIDRKQMEGTFKRIEDFSNRKMKNLLIVEDDANARKAIRKLIGNGDVKCLEAGNGNEALKIYKKNPIDCIVLDIGLSDINGFELIHKFEDEAETPVPPIIVYTGRELTREENDELEKYAESIIIKGIKSEERLLDETALFLHRTIRNLPESKQHIINTLYDKEAAFKGKRVLLVDDDMRNIFALSKVLKDKGLEVVKAENGKVALDLLKQQDNIDIVLMDIMMPEMDGYEATQKIRAQKALQSLPVIALTAKAMKDDRQKCIDAGADDYISKPVDMDRLFSLMRIWLSK